MFIAGRRACPAVPEIAYYRRAVKACRAAVDRENKVKIKNQSGEKRPPAGGLGSRV